MGIITKGKTEKTGAPLSIRLTPSLQRALEDTAAAANQSRNAAVTDLLTLGLELHELLTKYGLDHDLEKYALEHRCSLAAAIIKAVAKGFNIEEVAG